MSGASLNLVYTDHATEAILRALKQIQRRGQQPGPLLKQIGEYLVRSTQDRFDTQKGPDGTPWQPVSPRWWEKKKVKKILTESSRLRDSIVPRYSSNSVEWGTNVKYAGVHQEGKTINHPERSQVIHFKQKIRGQITRGSRNEEGKMEAGDLFSKKKGSHYAMKVQIGAHDTTMPARPFLGISGDDANEILARVQDYLSLDIAAAGLR
jgi:phage virion morphogenesis protein